MHLVVLEQWLQVGDTTQKQSGLKQLEQSVEAVVMKYSAAEWPIIQVALFAVGFVDFEKLLQVRFHLSRLVRAEEFQ